MYSQCTIKLKLYIRGGAGNFVKSVELEKVTCQCNISLGLCLTGCLILGLDPVLWNCAIISVVVDTVILK